MPNEEIVPDLRDLYAGMALIGLLSHHGAGTTDRYEVIAKGAFELAEAMLKERAK